MHKTTRYTYDASGRVLSVHEHESEYDPAFSQSPAIDGRTGQPAFAGQAGNSPPVKIFDTADGWKPDPLPDTVRASYRPLSDEETRNLKFVKGEFAYLLSIIKQHVPEGRERNIATQRVEEAVMWATKAITT